MEVIEEDIEVANIAEINNAVEINNDAASNQIIADPGLRPSMSLIGFSYVEREKIRRAYLTKGPYQPILTKYHVTLFSGKPHKFNPNWYTEYHEWLEYSESKDAVFCLCCYLFNIELGDQRFNHDSFVGEGFRNWKKKDRLNIELLICLSCLNPRDSFIAFDKQKLIQFARYYPLEFDETRLLALEDQLENYVEDLKSDEDLKGVGELAQRMFQKKKDIGFALVYMLVKLALVLPVATATVERVFLAMNLIKSILQNTMGDTWLNDCLVAYIEKDIFENISNEAIMQRFQDMKNRRILL